MAGGVVVNGTKTYFPDVYVTPEFANLLATPPGSGYVALVGSFPFLEQNVAYLSTTQTAFELLAPRDPGQLKLSNLLWNPSNDARAPGAPAGVYLFNIDTTTQAQAYLQDVTPANTVLLKSKIWGPRGNLTVVTVESESVGGKTFTSFTAANNGVTLDRFRVAGDDNVLTLTYLNPNAADGSSPYTASGFAGTGLSGTSSGWVKAAKAGDDLDLTFSVTLSASHVDNTGTHIAWQPSGPVDGAVTYGTGAGSVVAGGAGSEELVFLFAGTVNGVATWERCIRSAAQCLAGTTATTVTSWSTLTSVIVYPCSSGDAAAGVSTVSAAAAGTAGTPAGTIATAGPVFSGHCFPTMNEAAGQKYCSDVITYVSIYESSGFTASTGSSKASETLVASLDTKAATTIIDGLALGATAFWLVEAINANSVLVEASQVLQTQVDLSGDPLVVRLTGGSKTTGGTPEYTDCLETASWYDIDAIVPMDDSSAVHALVKDHVDYMSGVGANERSAYLGATADETLTALTTRAIALNERCSLICEQADRVTYNGRTVTLEPYEYAALLAAWECGNFGKPLTRKNPGIVAVYRNSSLATRDAQEQAIASGINITVTPPGRAPELMRHVTCYTTTEDASRTEASAMRSTFLTCRGVRAALRSALGSGATGATKAVIESLTTGALDRLVTAGTIQSWVASSLVVSQYADRWQVRFTYSPSYPVNFILVTPVVSIPIA